MARRVKTPERMAESDIEKYIRMTHKDVTLLRRFAMKNKWSEHRLATVCQAAIEAFENTFPKAKIPSLKELIQEMNVPATEGEVN